MSTLTMGSRRFDPGATLFDEPDVARVTRSRPLESPQRRREPSPGPTLDDVIAAQWERITSGAPVSCAICHGELHPVWSAASRPVGGRCQDCGSRLS